MDKNRIISKLGTELPGAILEVRKFGRSNTQSIWVESQSIHKVALFLKESSGFNIDWLENLSVVEFEEVLVVTYFARSMTQMGSTFVLRVSEIPSSPTSIVKFPSICSVWPMGGPLEQEASEMFGVHFVPNETPKHSDSEEPRKILFSPKLPENWEGFPLRKKYVFPTHYNGKLHARASNRMSPKKQNP